MASARVEVVLMGEVVHDRVWSEEEVFSVKGRITRNNWPIVIVICTLLTGWEEVFISVRKVVMVRNTRGEVRIT